MWDQHTEPAIDALAAGKHVFLEKPIASTVEDASKIIAASKRSTGILQVGHICRFNPRYRTAKQAIAAGKIGRIVAMSSRRNIPAAWTPQILNKIGPIVGDAVHDTDLMLWFTGERIVSAYAQTVDVRGLKYPDIGQTMYRFAGGATATLETVWCMPEKTPFDIDERMSVMLASFISRTLSRTLASFRLTNFIVQTPHTGRNSMEFAEERSARNSPISPRVL